MARRIKSEDEETNYWLSYSDMMAGLLLMFVLIISFTMLQAKLQYEAKEKELVAQQEAALAQEQKMQEQQEVMKEQQERLDQIVGVRADLIEALKDEFAGTDLKVSVDEKTGAITLDSSILFDVDKSEIKESGEQFLEVFLPKYLNVILSEKFCQYVSEIIVEGHTDTNGSYEHNLELSQKRALSVTLFCIKDNKSLKKGQIDTLRRIVTANGRSYSDPILNEDGEVNMAASRRVEFKFRLRDEEMVKEMIDILDEK